MTFRLPMSPRRFWAATVSAALVATGLFVVAAAPAGAATRAFSPIYTTDTTGDVTVRGNTLETCAAGSMSAQTTPVSCANVQTGTSVGVNNNFFMTYVDTDSDSTTFNSSSATVTIPTGATVLYAGLSWSGTAGAGSATGYPALTGVAAPNSSAKGTVSFKVPGASTYTAVDSTAAVDTTGSGYQGFKDVSAAVQAAGSGVYTVANVQAGTGGNDYAGWALAVAYRDPTQPLRNLVIYTGFTNVSNGASTTIPINGFTTPLTGGVVTRLGTLVYEGDRGNVGDTMTLGANAIANTLNPVNDVENSSVTDLGVAITARSPAYNNTLGVDIDRFDATGLFTNGQTSTTITLKTVGDGYYPGLVTLATNLYSPSLQATKTVRDVTSGITSSVKVGDTLAYSMAISNIGADGSTASILTDAVPAGTTYVPSSLVVGGTPVTDASGDDVGNVTGGTVTARLGTGASATAGGAMAPNASTTVAFNATVNAGTANGTVIANAAALGYSSVTTGTAFIGASNTVSSTVNAINVNPVLAFPAPPSGEVSASYTNTLTAAGGTGPYTWAVTGGVLPAGLVLNTTTGVISGTPTTSDIYNFTVSATDANAQVATETTSIYIAPLPTLTYSTPLQTADTGSAYSFPLGVNPGTGPYVWSVSVGTLPTGLTLDPSTGVISGTPTVAGSSSFTVKVVDAFGASATRATSLNVLAGPALNFPAPPGGEVSAPYTDQLTYSGGTGPYIWTTSAGALPGGLSLDSSSGLLSGTPTATGTFSFTVTVTDVNGAAASQATSVTVIAGPAVTFTPANGEVGIAYTAQPTASGGTSPYTWAVSAGTLPAGLSIDTGTGAITGTPTAASAASVTVQATDAVGGTAAQARTITIVAAPTLTGTLATGEVTVTPYSSGFTLNGGTGPFSWTITSGTLPAGLSFSTSTGLITGTPTAAGSYPLTVQVTDANNSTATRSGTITVVPTPTLTGTLAGGELTAPYSSGFTVNDGIGPFVWSLSSGTLPAGLSLNTSTGLITGTPTATGSTAITVRAKDAKNKSTTRPGTITVTAGPAVTFATPPSGEVGVAFTAQPTASGGTGPYTWAVSAGTLPAGLSINTSSGAITGTPSTSGTTNVTVQVTDNLGATATQARDITIVAAPTLTGSLGGGELTAPYSSGFTVNDGTGPFVWSISAGTLPAGLSFNTSTGLITGTPTATGSSTITVGVTDAKNSTTTRSGTITVTAGPVVAFTPASGEVGVAYAAQPTASGGTGPYTWVVSAGTLPAGLTINGATGAIGGTPSAAGSTSVTVRATDANGGTATQAGSIVIVAAPTLTFAAPPATEVGATYSDQLTKSGGVGPFTWTVSVATLPAGLTLASDTGLLSGTPTALGTSTFTVRIVDSNGQVDTKSATIVVNKTTSTVSVSTSASVRFGNTVAITATVGPSSPGGTVTFTDVPTTGPQAGTTVTLGTRTVSTGSASLTTTLPAFGVNTITASYGGDATHTAVTSPTTQVEVSAYAGEVIVTEYRTSGPGGAGDNYVELLNTGPTVPLAGIKVSADSGAIATLPADAGLLGTGRSYLITGAGFTLAALATSDYSVATVGTGGMKVTAPDTAATRTDAVGPATGFHTGTGLLPITGDPDSNWAWVRTELAGAAVDSRDNAGDFQLVSTGLAPVGGVQPTLGSPSPTGTADPYQHDATLQSTLLDTGKGVAVAPNRVVVSGTPGRLVIRRTITNTTGQTVTAAKVRVSALSEQFGAPQPGVANQPAGVARLHAINPAAPTELVTVTGGASVTVNDLSVDAPSAGPGGGLNSTFTVPLPGGGLAPGASINVAFTFAVETHGTFWFGYDVDATTTAAPSTPAARHANRAATQIDGRSSARRSAILHSAARVSGYLR